MSTSIAITIPANRRRIDATAQRRIKAIARSCLFFNEALHVSDNEGGMA